MITIACGGAAADGYGAGVSVPRRTTAAGRLARLGFADPGRAERLLGDLAMDGGKAGDALIDTLGTAADPDLRTTAPQAAGRRQPAPHPGGSTPHSASSAAP